VFQARQDPVDVVGIVLTVGIDLDDRTVLVAECVLESGTHGAADTQIEREPENRGARFRSDPRSVVLGPVIHHQDIVLGNHSKDVSDGVTDRLGFVPRWHDDENARTP